MKKSFILLYCIFASLAYAQIPTNGLIAFYPLGISQSTGNSTLGVHNDISGNGHNLSFSNGFGFGPNKANVPNEAAAFNGVSSDTRRFDYSNAASAFQTTGNFTICAWVRLGSPIANEYSSIVQVGNNDIFLRFRLTANGDFIQGGFRTGGTTFAVLSSSIIRTNFTNNWAFIMFRRTGAQLEILVNNVQIGTNNFTTSPIAHGSTNRFFTVGNSIDPNTCIIGRMQDVLFYNRSLSSIEATTVYNGCETPVNNTPIANLTICEGATTNLSVTGFNISWFNTASGGTPLNTGINFTTPTLNRDTTFYAQQGTCLLRTAIQVKVIPLTNPSAPDIITDTNVNYCIGNRAWLEASASIGTIRWYNVSSGGNYLDTGKYFLTPTLSNNSTYYAESSTGCGAQSISARLPINLKVSGNGDLANNTPSYLMYACNNISTATQLSVNTVASAVEWRWSGPIINTGKTITTPLGITRDTTFWAIAKQAGSCTATLPIQVKSYGLIAQAPANTSPSYPNPVCPGDSITLKATPLDIVPLVWRNFNNQVVGVGDSIRIPNSRDGKFTVRRGDGFCASSITNVQITTPVTPLATITYSNDTIKASNTFDSYKLYRNGVEVAAGNTGSFAVPVSCGEYRATFTNTANTCGSFSALVRRVQIPAGPGALCYYYDFQSFNGLQFPALMSWSLGGQPAEPSMPVNQTGITSTSNWICPASGTLNVRIKSANGCYYNASFLVQNITNIYNQLPGGFQGVDSLTTCTILSNILNVTLPATINLSFPNLVCNGSTAQFTGSMTVPGNIVWYEKATGGSPISTGTNFTTTSLDTSYTVYAARNYMGCESQRISRTANVQGKINVKISSSSDTICENTVIQLTASNDLPNATYAWNNGLGSGALKSFRPSQTDSFRVIATVNGCRDTAYKFITVKPKSSYQFKVTQCAGTSYTFNGQTLTSSNTYEVTLRNAVGCDSLVTLELSFLDQISNQINAAICSGQSYRFKGIDLTSNGTYRDTLKSVFSCDSIVILNLSVNPLPTPTVTQNGQELSTQNFSAYQWKLNNNNIAGANSKTFTPSVTGEYSVEVTDNNSCKNISEPFTVSTVGLLGSTKNQLSVKIFPNPANEQVMLTELPSQTKIQILTMEGKILYTKWNEQKYETINTKDWAPGVYLISLEVDNMKQLTKIFITH